MWYWYQGNGAGTGTTYPCCQKALAVGSCWGVDSKWGPRACHDSYASWLQELQETDLPCGLNYVESHDNTRSNSRQNAFLYYCSFICSKLHLWWCPCWRSSTETCFSYVRFWLYKNSSSTTLSNEKLYMKRELKTKFKIKGFKLSSSSQSVTNYIAFSSSLKEEQFLTAVNLFFHYWGSPSSSRSIALLYVFIKLSSRSIFIKLTPSCFSAEKQKQNVFEGIFETRRLNSLLVIPWIKAKKECYIPWYMFYPWTASEHSYFRLFFHIAFCNPESFSCELTRLKGACIS